MHFKLVLFVVGSLVAANALESRQQPACTGEQLCCGSLKSVEDEDVKASLQAANITTTGLTGSVGTDCKPAAGNDPEELCSGDIEPACCPKTQPSPKFYVNCTAIGE